MRNRKVVEISRMHKTGRPVLTNVEQSDALSVQLQGAKIPHEVFVGTILSYDNLSIEM